MSNCELENIEMAGAEKESNARDRVGFVGAIFFFFFKARD